jgi:EmrB/QacA subfamily drug resistance transporter
VVALAEHRSWTLAVVCVGIFMLLLDITIVNIALPQITIDLHATFSDLQWVIDAYAVSLAALLLIAGSLGDLFGARRIFLGGLVVFCIASLLCGLAQSPLFLIVSRAVQGIGGAAMFATSLALLAHEFQGKDRGFALGVWGATAGAAIAVGPLIGGALTSGGSWRWIFFVNLPIGAAALTAGLLRVRDTQRRSVRPDWPGFITFGLALVGVTYGLIRGNPDGWSSPSIVAAFVAGFALLIAFLVIESRRRQPMLELGLFRNPALVGASLSAFAIAASLFSMLLYITLYLQDILGYSPFQTGIRFLPLTAMVLVAAPLAGRLSAHVPLRLLIGVGLGLVTLGLGLMTLVGPTSGWTVLLPGMVVAGIGSGLTNPPLASAAVGTVSRDRAGVGSGINNTFRQVGIAVGIAGLGAIFTSRVQSAFVQDLTGRAPQLASRAGALAQAFTTGGGPQQTPGGPPAAARAIQASGRAAFVTGLDAILWIAVIVAAAGAITAAVLIRSSDVHGVGEGAAAGDGRRGDRMDTTEERAEAPRIAGARRP